MGKQVHASERQIIYNKLDKGEKIQTEVRQLKPAVYPNPVSQRILGVYRPPDKRKNITADAELIERFIESGKPVPGFLEAGPREKLAFEEPKDVPYTGVKVAIVTAGGLYASSGVPGAAGCWRSQRQLPRSRPSPAACRKTLRSAGPGHRQLRQSFE